MVILKDFPYNSALVVWLGKKNDHCIKWDQMKKGRDDFICKWGAIYIAVNDEYNEICFHYGDDLQIYFRIFL